MPVYHIPTVYLLTGLLYLILPLMVWFVLFSQPSRVKALWCVAGELFGMGLIMVGLRSYLPVWVSYPFANAVMWTAVFIQTVALQRALGQRLSLRWVALLVLACLSVFEFFRWVLQDAVLRFTWSMLIFVLVFCLNAYLCWRIASVHQLKSARWLSAVYVLTATIMLTRALRVVWGFAEPDIVSQEADSALTIVPGLLIAVLGNFAFVAMFVERSRKGQIKAAAERVRQEESARLGEQIAPLERQRTLGAMSASFAHELSQPLTAILMDAQAIKTSVASGTSHSSKEILESVEEIEKSTYRTVKLVERIRNFIRPAQTDHELVDLKTLLQDVAQLLAYPIRTQHIHFDFDLDASPCVVHGDRIQLSQIVLNVYRNAMEAMENCTDKKVHVSLARVSDHVVLRVRDNGPGISADLTSSVGQPFVTSKEHGLGLGLSISTTIAELHGGSLAISNAAEGGAIVELCLPAVSH
jgi:signal transduction histidine kinase